MSARHHAEYLDDGEHPPLEVHRLTAWWATERCGDLAGEDDDLLENGNGRGATPRPSCRTTSNPAGQCSGDCER